MPRSSSIKPMALQLRKPPEEARITLAIFLAMFTSEVARFTLKATRGIRAPMAVMPAVGWIFRSPKSGAHSGWSSFSGMPSNWPLRQVARFRRSGRVAESSYRKLGIFSSSQIRWPRRLVISTHSSTVTPIVGTRGMTSVAPMRECSPLCLVMSMTSAAFLVSWKATSSMASGEPTRVNTQRLWLPSVWASSRVQPGTLLATSTRAL